MAETVMNMRFLAVDQGNSYVKLYLMEEGATVSSCRLKSDDTESILAFMDAWRPDCGAFCTVGRKDARLLESLRLALSGSLLILGNKTPLPVGVAYGTPDTLGLDRLALAAGAASMFPGEALAVVDAGTAVTLDVVDSSPAFVGGRISAGLRLRLNALHDHTAALPLIPLVGDTPVAGNSTVTSLRSGAILGLAGEISETYRQYAASFGCSRLLLTGGDAETLAPRISPDVPALSVPDLIARGLLDIFLYNETDR